MTFVLVDIGCIECGMDTEVIGIYERKADADKAFEDHIKEVEADKWGAYFTGGQRQIEVLEVSQ